MAIKYATGFPPVASVGATDQMQVVQGGADGDATLQQVKNYILTNGTTANVGNSNSIPVLQVVDGIVTSALEVPPTGIYRVVNDADATLQATDQNGTVVLSGSSARVCTIPTFASASIPVNAIIKVCNKTLSTTITPAGGVTLVGGAFLFNGTNTTAYLQQTNTNIWELLNPSELPFWSHIQFTDVAKDLAYSDQFNWQVYFSGSNTTITVQPLLSVPIQIGATITYLQKSTGKIQFLPGSGVTIISNQTISLSGTYETTTAGDMAILRHESTNVWSLVIISSMASQPSTTVTISGGTIDGTSIGDTIPAAARITTLSITQPAGFSNSPIRQLAAGVQTTNATQTALVSILLNEAESITLSGTITAAQSDHSNAVGGTFSITARRATAGNVTLVGSVVTNVQSSSAATFTCAVDTGTQTVRVLVTGIAATIYNWAANYTYQLVLTNA